MRGYIFFSILKVVDVLYQTPQQEKCYQIPKDDHSNSFHNVFSDNMCRGYHSTLFINAISKHVFTFFYLFLNIFLVCLQILALWL